MDRNDKTYDKNIYPRFVLESAISAYKSIASIKIKEKDGAFMCSFGKSKADTQIVINEFDNYLIELLNS